MQGLYNADSTTVRVDRAAARDLKSIATDIARKERRPVTLGEVVRRLIEIGKREWAAGGGA